MKELLYGAAYYDEYMPYDRLDKVMDAMEEAFTAPVRSWTLPIRCTFSMRSV